MSYAAWAKGQQMDKWIKTGQHYNDPTHCQLHNPS